MEKNLELSRDELNNLITTTNAKEEEMEIKQQELSERTEESHRNMLERGRIVRKMFRSTKRSLVKAKCDMTPSGVALVNAWKEATQSDIVRLKQLLGVENMVEMGETEEEDDVSEEEEVDEEVVEEEVVIEEGENIETADEAGNEPECVQEMVEESNSNDAETTTASTAAAEQGGEEGGNDERMRVSTIDVLMPDLGAAEKKED